LDTEEKPKEKERRNRSRVLQKVEESIAIDFRQGGRSKRGEKRRTRARRGRGERSQPLVERQVKQWVRGRGDMGLVREVAPQLVEGKGGW
jgi:hypothetical protein